MAVKNIWRSVLSIIAWLVIAGCSTYGPIVSSVAGISHDGKEIRVRLPEDLSLENLSIGERILELRKRDELSIRISGRTKLLEDTLVFESYNGIDDDAIYDIVQLYLYDNEFDDRIATGQIFSPSCELALCAATVHCIPGHTNSPSTCVCTSG